jgi:hypothetical protein
MKAGVVGSLIPSIDRFRRALLLVVLVIADCLRRDAIVIKEFVCMARIFTGDQIDVAENLECAVRDVCEIADRSGDEIKSAGHGRILSV